ncbi:MAG: UDP-N-acetylmuramyl-tripeptide synthetase [Deltaproteobacteria bacterium]|nr:UDP-N-acetylmuramyl-tripeptide synthetase [Deltaproteobacteria bacterium]
MTETSATTAWWPSPADRARLRTVCVTGTNGKTTTTSMIASIVGAAGEIAARVTTVGAWVGDVATGSGPGWEPFRATVAAALDAGTRTFALEVTSKALAAGFAERWPPDVAVFTNLTRDHLDRHGTPEHYLASKARLFLALPPTGVAVLNAADEASALLDEVIDGRVRRSAYATRPVAAATAGLPIELAAREVVVSREGTRVVLVPSRLADALGGELRLSVLSAVHADNALAAALAADAVGYTGEAIRRGLESFGGVEGRFEVVSRQPLVVVDYAHTPDALEGTLRSARAIAGTAGGRVICVFGCGGDRDRGKRPMMGRIAGTMADLVVLTSDNPRSEDPERILDEIAGGAGGAASWSREPDRAAAIDVAIGSAREQDVVVIAGKGHEQAQQVGATTRLFSDVEVARGAVARRRGD